MVAWRDVLHEGPVPAVSDAGLRRVRTDFLAEAGAADLGTGAEFDARDAALEAHRDGAFVLWFEADLYDQRAVLPHTASTPLDADAFAHATLAWSAFRAPDPGGLDTIARSRSPVLRFVSEAFDRLAREYPSTRDGLSLTERRLLAAVAGRGLTAGDVFERAAAREARPFLGDTWAFDRLARLAAVDTPLLPTTTSRSTGSTAGSAAYTSRDAGSPGAGTRTWSGWSWSTDVHPTVGRVAGRPAAGRRNFASNGGQGSPSHREARS